MLLGLYSNPPDFAAEPRDFEPGGQSASGWPNAEAATNFVCAAAAGAAPAGGFRPGRRTPGGRRRRAATGCESFCISSMISADTWNLQCTLETCLRPEELYL